MSDNTQTYENALPSSAISIADLISDVKDDSGSFFKYLPDSMLNEARIASKNVAIAEDEERIAGMRQEYAEDRKAKETARKMRRNGQRGFSDTYKGETVRAVAPQDVTAGYRAVYNATKENRAMTEAEAQAAAKIPDTMVKAAETAARADAVAEILP